MILATYNIGFCLNDISKDEVRKATDFALDRLNDRFQEYISNPGDYAFVVELHKLTGDLEACLLGEEN